jgi:hypothetical protein
MSVDIVDRNVVRLALGLDGVSRILCGCRLGADATDLEQRDAGRPGHCAESFARGRRRGEGERCVDLFALGGGKSLCFLRYLRGSF